MKKDMLNDMEERINNNQVVIKRYMHNQFKKNTEILVQPNECCLIFPSTKKNEPFDKIENQIILISKNNKNVNPNWQVIYVFNSTKHTLEYCEDRYNYGLTYQVVYDYGINSLANCFEHVHRGGNNEYCESVLASDLIQYLLRTININQSDYNKDKYRKIYNKEIEDRLKDCGIKLIKLSISRSEKELDIISPMINSSHLIINNHSKNEKEKIILDQNRKVVFGYASSTEELKNLYTNFNNYELDKIFINFNYQPPKLLCEVTYKKFTNNFQLNYCRNDPVFYRPIFIYKFDYKKIIKFNGDHNLYHGDKIIIGEPENPIATIHVFDRE